jgi:hypothetical protein
MSIARELYQMSNTNELQVVLCDSTYIGMMRCESYIRDLPYHGVKVSSSVIIAS